ncbi:malonic semialdehyde reductase [Halolamina pelagica]|uniref:Malonic semialdehyde reductase n=1 Tax=Halolamina pelagica TaxID=699431 RepID=A0A0P7GRT2_9EURY|nr:nitroreductase family protein [Halolamina pelagica]KPN32029.1 malonic semialdehyde reductase [Halolamina pelagica]
MEFDEAVQTRRSVHEYSDEPVDDATIEAVFEQVRYSPSSYNLQPWEFLVLTEDENRERLKEVAYGQEHVTDAPVAVAVLGNTDPSAHAEAVAEDQLRKGYLPNEEAKAGLIETIDGMAERGERENRLWTTRSTALAGMTLMHAARAEGLSTCPVGGFDGEALQAAFDIDDQYEPVMLVTMGHAAANAQDTTTPRKFRRSVEDIVHRETFEPTAAELDDEAVAEH